ncbi:hypothetical protein EDD59_106150 [Muricomes intestini]|uniref:Uncharacterized protein n=1 Tax=Muricomes intestini TaxID=1796634 RepID=A0A4R3KB13_9FIRM|nr:hypothetical protein EDD59_106150 [Muricomes intestini]
MNFQRSFLPEKAIYKKLGEVELSPYMRNSTLYNDGEAAIKATQQAMCFADFMKHDLSKTKQNFELFWNAQDAILFPKLENLVSKYSYIPITKINNRLDASMALHQLLLTTTGISNVIGAGSLQEYSRIGKTVIGTAANFDKIFEFIENNQIDFCKIERNAFKLIDLFAKIYEQLVPVVALRNGNCVENVDKEQHGIMTANFNELSDFYAKSFEWILENVAIIIGLNNIYLRSDWKQCVNGKTYADFLKETKGNRLQNGYIGEKEPFSKSVNSLNNKIRNAIQHFDSDIDYKTQLLTFKDRNKSVNLYLLEFADLCIENFCIIFYILELIYNLQKSTLTQEGNVPIFLINNLEVQRTSNRKNREKGTLNLW